MIRSMATALSAAWLLAFCAAPAAGWSPAGSGGEVRGSNLLEYQIGRDPTAEADELTKLYDLFDLEYSNDGLRLGARLESYRLSADQDFAPARYDALTRKFAEWSAPGLRLRVGNGYATLGRGLLLRAFELSGVVQTAAFPTRRYVDSRDIDGVVIDAERGRFSLQGVSGRPIKDPAAPPDAEDFFVPRRGGYVSGGRIGFDVGRGARIGAGYLRTDDVAGPGSKDTGAVDLDLRIDKLAPQLRERGVRLNFYGEYAARDWRPFSDGLDTRDGKAHAFYTATELAYRRWGLSLETKDYHRFALVVNDPPDLIPEFGQHLLNRATHLLLPNDEKGHQASLQGALPGDWTAQVDWSAAVNRRDVLGSFADAQDYRLVYVGVESPFAGDWRGRFFAATGKDEMEGVTDRWTVGAEGERSLGGGWSVTSSLEYQKTERLVFAEREKFETLFMTVGTALAGSGSVAIIGEFSNDPAEKDDVFTPEQETDPRTWLGFVASAPITASHEAVLFAGDRRGGTACASGTCYRVPDFSGVEIRVESRF